MNKNNEVLRLAGLLNETQQARRGGQAGRVMTKAQIIEALKDAPDDADVYVVDVGDGIHSNYESAPVERAVYEMGQPKMSWLDKPWPPTGPTTPGESPVCWLYASMPFDPDYGWAG